MVEMKLACGDRLMVSHSGEWSLTYTKLTTCRGAHSCPMTQKPIPHHSPCKLEGGWVGNFHLCCSNTQPTYDVKPNGKNPWTQAARERFEVLSDWWLRQSLPTHRSSWPIRIDQYSISVKTWAIIPSTLTPSEAGNPNQTGDTPNMRFMGPNGCFN